MRSRVLKSTTARQPLHISHQPGLQGQQDALHVELCAVHSSPSMGVGYVACGGQAREAQTQGGSARVKTQMLRRAGNDHDVGVFGVLHNF